MRIITIVCGVCILLGFGLRAPGGNFRFVYNAPQTVEGYFSHVAETVDVHGDWLPVLYAGYTDQLGEGLAPVYCARPTRPTLLRMPVEKFLTPMYLIEFDPKDCVNRLPIEVQDAIAAEFPESDLSHGLYAMLTRQGVTDIYCTGSGYYRVRDANLALDADRGVIISLIGFLGNKYLKPCDKHVWLCEEGYVRAGIFDPVGVSPIGLPANTLITVNVRWPGVQSAYWDAGLRCAFDNDGEGVSFYVVALTEDKTRLMVAHVFHALFYLVPPGLWERSTLINSIEDLGKVIQEFAQFYDLPKYMEQTVHAAKCLTGLALDPVKREQSEVEVNARQKRIEKLRLKRLIEELTLGPNPTALAIMLASTTLNKMFEVKEKPQSLPFIILPMPKSKDVSQLSKPESSETEISKIMAKSEEERTKQERIILKNAKRKGQVSAEGKKQPQT